MNFGKKILSAFVEVEEGELRAKENAVQPQAEVTYRYNSDTTVPDKFIQHFDKLFLTRNQPGPDYFEMSKMLEAMQTIGDEKARFSAAFAGLAAQGLTKDQLLRSADNYLKMLQEDAGQFKATVDSTLQEKVEAKKQATLEKSARIQQLSSELSQLQQQIEQLQNEIAENEEKIRQNEGGYEQALLLTQNRILTDIEKIKQHIL